MPRRKHRFPWPARRRCALPRTQPWSRASGPWVGALLLALMVTAPGAHAAKKKKSSKADTAAPTITHTPPAGHTGAGPLIVEAQIVDDSGVFDPALLVRAPGGAFERVAMLPLGDKPDTFGATVPEALLGGDLEYLIEAFDENGNGPARAGDEAAPLRIARVAAPPPPPPPPPPQETTARPAADEGDNGALLWGAGIAVGGVLLLGAAAGVGYAIYALSPSTPATVSVSIQAPSPIASGVGP